MTSMNKNVTPWWLDGDDDNGNGNGNGNGKDNVDKVHSISRENNHRHHYNYNYNYNSNTDDDIRSIDDNSLHIEHDEGVEVRMFRSGKSKRGHSDRPLAKEGTLTKSKIKAISSLSSLPPSKPAHQEPSTSDSNPTPGQVEAIHSNMKMNSSADDKPSRASQLTKQLSKSTQQLSKTLSEQWQRTRSAFSKSGSLSNNSTSPPSMSSTSSGLPSDGALNTQRSTVDRSNSSRSDNSDRSSQRRYSVQELIQSLGHEDLPPALERRVRDFSFAQRKRKERHGENKAWGIFGLYAHLSDIRADLEWAEDAAWRRQQHQPYLSWSDFEKTRDAGLTNRPWFTYGVLAVCTIMLIVTFGVNGWKIEPLNVNPLIGPSSETLVKVGARETNLIVNEGQWFRLFTPLILHAGLVHYIINMLALYFIGGAVEQAHGMASAAVLFVVPAVGGNILSAICLPQYISVGASGGIFGLIGACLADISINWNLLFLKTTVDNEDRWRHYMVLFWLFMDIMLNCLIGFTPFVDNFTHLGGFMYGFLCGWSTIEKLAVGFFGLHSKSQSWKTTLVRFLGLIISVLSIMITTVVLVQSDGVTSPCHGCRYISCVPFPPRAEERWWECDDCDFVTADLFVNGEGTGLYEEIALECPDGQVETIDVASRGWYDKEPLRKALPSYCRDVCENVFASS